MYDKQAYEIEEHLQEHIHRLVDEALAEATQHPGLTHSDIKDIALAVRPKVGQEEAQALVREQGMVSVPGPTREQCGREMHDKGLKKRRLVSCSGEVDWERASYYCETCRRGFFPPR